MRLTRQIARAARRSLDRLIRRSGVDAAGGGRRWSNFHGIAAPESATLAARGAAKARAAALALNTPSGARIVEAWASNLVGRGWQARSGHPDEDTRRRLSAEFEAMVGPILVPLARALVRDGEAFVRLLPDDFGGLELRLLPADQVDPSLTRDLGGGARIVAGVEFDAADRVVAFHVLREPPGSPLGAASFEAVRVPAQDMIHVLDRAFPGQVRGLSWLAPVALKLRDRDEASDALLMQLKVAAALTGFVTDPDGTGGGFPGQRSGEKLDLTLAPGALRVLPSGAGIEFTPVTPALAQAVDFLRSMDREIAAGAGLTYEQLTGDLSEANYSSARVGLLEFRRRAEMLQRSLIEAQLLRPLWARWISTQALAGSIPADPESLAAYGAVRFVAPGWAWVDPLKEAQGEIAAIGAGLKSRAEVVAARGRDLDELDAELEADSFRPAGRAAPAEPQDEDDEGRGRAAA